MRIVIVEDDATCLSNMEDLCKKVLNGEHQIMLINPARKDLKVLLGEICAFYPDLILLDDDFGDHSQSDESDRRVSGAHVFEGLSASYQSKIVSISSSKEVGWVDESRCYLFKKIPNKMFDKTFLMCVSQVAHAE